MTEIKGHIKMVGKTEQVSDKFTKREFVVTTADKYPQDIIIQCTQDKVKMLDNLPDGTEVTAYVNIRGKEWKSPKGELKYFISLECWKLDVDGASTTEKKKQSKSKEDEDDLPF